MIASIVGLIFLNSVGVHTFVGAFLEYYIARHDLSEAQVARILKEFPAFLVPYLVPNSSNIESLIKQASTSNALGLIGMSALMAIAIIVNLFLALSEKRLLLAFVISLVLLADGYAIHKFFGIIEQSAHEPL